MRFGDCECIEIEYSLRERIPQRTNPFRDIVSKVKNLQFPSLSGGTVLGKKFGREIVGGEGTHDRPNPPHRRGSIPFSSCGSLQFPLAFRPVVENLFFLIIMPILGMDSSYSGPERARFRNRQSDRSISVIRSDDTDVRCKMIWISDAK